MRQHMDRLEKYTDILIARLDYHNNSSDPYQYIPRPVYSPPSHQDAGDVQEDTSSNSGQGDDTNELVASTKQLKARE
jgi:hypothetical protein